MKRTIVGLRKNNGKYVVPTFTDCLVDYFSKDLKSVTIDYSLENGTLFVAESKDGYELAHSPECPFRSLLSQSEEKNNIVSEEKNYIGVAASVVIESSDNHVLLTKRSGHLRASPNVWVVPGGHIDYGETVFETAIREVKEETGLIIAQEKMSVLGLWENVYPLLLGVGTPKSHALVIYLYTKLSESSEELAQKLVSNPEEVDSYCWLSTSILTKLLNREESLEEGKQYIFENEVMIEKSLDYNKMFNNWLWSQPNPYSGVNYALRKWMNKIILSSPSSKF